MFPNEVEIMLWFSQYAYQPWLIYTAVIVMMTLSSFGLPLPEEITILALGLIVYMGRNPHLYPPPTPNAAHVDLVTAMIVCLFAVFFSDYLVFYLGKIFGKNKKVLSIIHRFVSEKSFNKTKLHIQKHSFWVPALFRFTPGIRFPGHFSCGMLGIKRTQFILTDGTAALFSVPTQIFVFAYYGETILSTITIIKQYFLAVIIVVLLVYIGKKLYKKNKLKKDNI